MNDGDDITGGFTELMFNAATTETLTLQKAVELLRQNAHVRTLSETLGKYTKIPADNKKELIQRITDAVLANSPPDVNQDSVSRNVRNWINHDASALSKRNAILLCFALGLTLKESDTFLWRCCGESFHWRDPRDIVYIYAIREGMSYPDAKALEQDMAKKGLLEMENREDISLHTDVVRSTIEKFGSVGELETYLRESKAELGTMHNTAYSMFMEYMKLLGFCPTSVVFSEKEEAAEKKRASGKKEDDEGVRNDSADKAYKSGMRKERVMPVREITDVYLYDRLIPRIQRKTKNNGEAEKRTLDVIQKEIQQNWPDESTLSRIISRKLDVPRKLLILLFMATDGNTYTEVQQTADTDIDRALGMSWADENFQNEELFRDWDGSGDYDQDEDFFQEQYERINTMLQDCGFAPLDARNPFDWMILYCMCVDDSLLVDERMQSFLTELFREDGSNPSH